MGLQSISNMCTVFAESEVVSLIATGIAINEIANGIDRAIAKRTYTMAKRIMPAQVNGKIAMSGGVANNGGVVRALEKLFGCSLNIPPSPEIIGALGAALYARETD